MAHQELLFFKPSVPFGAHVKQALEGLLITVCGKVMADSHRFQVDLQHKGDVVLHVGFYYKGDSEYVGHNTYQNGIWGREEIVPQTPFPRGQTFVLQILITQESYKISANGKPFSEFKHRIPFSLVDSVNIGGKVELSLLTFQHSVPDLDALSGPFTVPYRSAIRGGLQPGKIIIVHGIINSQAKRIHINLCHKSGIAFHYNPRFDQNAVIGNTFEKAKWSDVEERSKEMPFKRGEIFQVIIFCSQDHFKVFVDGEEKFTFNHRFTKLEEVDVLEAGGDMQLTFVQG